MNSRLCGLLCAFCACVFTFTSITIAQAADVILDGNTVTRIENLEVPDDQGGVTVYDVVFRFETGRSVYGGGCFFPFGDIEGGQVNETNAREDAFAVLVAINNALNANIPVPTSAGVPSQNIYYIGLTYAISNHRLFVVALGGEFLGAAGWEACQAPTCFPNGTPVAADVRLTYADLSVDGPTSIVAASLPSSRSVQVGNLASAFATIINTSNNAAATDCRLAPQTSVAANFAYQTTDASNVPVGTPNTPADIAACGSQNFIFGFLPTAAMNPTEVLLTYDCTNSAPAPVTVGLNTLLLSASVTPVPDIVALARTSFGIEAGILGLRVGWNAFSVATVNVGSTATITASAVPSVALPLVMSICETNPATGACLSAPASSVTSSVGEGATGTYSVFVTATGAVPYDPANNRINVKFWDADGVVRGLTSVAVRN